MEEDFTIAHVIDIMKKTKKTDPLFKPLKKLKTALESIQIGNVSFEPTNRVFVFHFGLGNELDKEFLALTNPANLAKNVEIIPGHSYCILEFNSPQDAAEYLSTKIKIQGKPVFYQELVYQNLKRTLIYLFCKENFQKEKEIFAIPNCPSKYAQGSIPGLIVVEDVITKQEELALLQNIDQGNWERLNNRRVQHYGYAFKYGRNQIDKDQNQGELPKYFNILLQKLNQIPILKGIKFDQLTINDYFAGNGIPAHFDTHSPFEEVFIAVSLLSGLVMDWRKYDGQQKQVYLKDRSVTIFSGEARYAWTHGITCRKVDKVDNQILYRSRRLSLTFRKIKFTPCVCPYYFYCDSQGYNQQTMKKNNPLLAKYLSQKNAEILSKFSPSEIEKEFVVKAYNGFGFDFHNKVIQQLKVYLQNEVEEGDVIVDIGCGNGEYKKYVRQGAYYIGVEKCRTMITVDQQLFMDCKCLALKEQSCDKILMVAVLHHLASQKSRITALIECLRALKTGGILYLTVLSYQQKQHIYNSPEILLEYCLPVGKIQEKEKMGIDQTEVQEPRMQERGQIYKRYYHLFTVQQLKDLLKQSGFTVAEIQNKGQNIICKAVKGNQ